jgi:hypothetical protein
VRRANVQKKMMLTPATPPEIRPMPSLAPLVQAFAGEELAIRRLYRRDATFRAICDDYCDAHVALTRWRSAGPGGRATAEDFHVIVTELAAEIAGHLQTENRSATHTP